MVKSYRRPPITEAVIEIKVEGPIERGLIDKVKDRLLTNYPIGPQENTNFNIELGAEPRVQKQFLGYRLTAPDGAGVVSVAHSSIGTSKLAPYEGWEPFIARARENWEIWKRSVGWRKVIRVGVRYLNRIDIPNRSRLSLSDYLGAYIEVPSKVMPIMASFAFSTTGPLGEDECNLVINSSSTASPLLDATSFIIDLDVSRERDLPQNDEGLWAFIDLMRAHKNRVFEGCITDNTRNLFDT
jgi:uncharacterized protein (TIGR04255 family)